MNLNTHTHTHSIEVISHRSMMMRMMISSVCLDYHDGDDVVVVVVAIIPLRREWCQCQEGVLVVAISRRWWWPLGSGLHRPAVCVLVLGVLSRLTSTGSPFGVSLPPACAYYQLDTMTNILHLAVVLPCAKNLLRPLLLHRHVLYDFSLSLVAFLPSFLSLIRH